MSNPQAPIVLATGAIARYPLAKKGVYSTKVVKFADLSRQTAAQIATPLSSWVINPDLLQDSERSDWWNFFQAQQGSYLPFLFVDPADNLLQYSEQQENSPWVAGGTGTSVAAPNTTIADPFGIVSSRPRNLSMSNLHGIYYQVIPVAPAGSGNSRTKGLTVTASIWIQKVGLIGSCVLEVADSLSGEIASTTCNLSTAWQRFSVTHTFSPSNPASGIEIVLAGWSTSGTVCIFGAQLEIGGTASGYKQSSSYCGVHPNCYFQTDEFDMTQSEFNLGSIQLAIEESN